MPIAPEQQVNQHAAHAMKENDPTTLVGHYTHHARRPSVGGASKMGLEQSIADTVESGTNQMKEQTYKHTGMVDVQVVPPHSHTVVSHSLSVHGAYRDSIHSVASSASSTAVSSAASSVVSSRQSSRQGSISSSQATSEQSSRATSPSHHHAHHHHHSQSSHPHQNGHHMHAHSVQPLASIDGQLQSAGISKTVSKPGIISFAHLQRSETIDSDDELAPQGRPHQRILKPNHFTFCESDIMKSFLRAAERDRARAEREERAREAQKKLLEEQEYERRKAQQRELAARELARHAQQHQQSSVTYARDTVGADWDDSSSDDSPSPRRRRRFPLAPAHFKFSTNDVHRSSAKPSQRQNIGHWSTFPQSSIAVLSAEQLKMAIDAAIRIQKDQEREERRQQSIAANASASARLSSRMVNGHRFVTTHSDGSPSRPTGPIRSSHHARSRTQTHDLMPRMSPLDSGVSVPTGPSQDFPSTLRRASLGSESRSAMFERSTNVAASNRPVKTIGPIHIQPGQENGPKRHTSRHSRTTSLGGEPLTFNGYTPTPNYGSHSPMRTSNQSAVASRSVKLSASPSQPSSRTIGHGRSVSLTPHPPSTSSAGAGARRPSLHGGDSKHASAHNSPTLIAAGGADPIATWQSVYERTINEVRDHNQSSNGNLSAHSTPDHTNGYYRHTASSLYKDVGYGRR